VAELGDVVTESIDHLGLCLEEGGEEFWLLDALLDELGYEDLVRFLGGVAGAAVDAGFAAWVAGLVGGTKMGSAVGFGYGIDGWRWNWVAVGPELGLMGRSWTNFELGSSIWIG